MRYLGPAETTVAAATSAKVDERIVNKLVFGGERRVQLQGKKREREREREECLLNELCAWKCLERGGSAGF
jgi:hypothetical protein